MENEHKREVIEVEADTLQDFMNEELDRRIAYMEKQNEEGVEPEVKEITRTELLIPFIFAGITAVMHLAVQFIAY